MAPPSVAATPAFHPENGTAAAPAAPSGPSFIETQLPVSRLSKESYKERKANYSQTLTGLGKWWGRKPLVMVRAVILGLLMPASDDPRKDRDVFLALLTMDEAGLWRRKRRNIPLGEVHRRLSPTERREWFAPDCNPDRPRLKKGTSAAERQRLQRIVFDRMGYDEKLRWCDRPEQVDGPSPESWKAINEHLGTSASSLPELVRVLGERRFGRVPRVGDAFCGGGSVPFEAARIGCEAYGSDLNPVAALLTWGALHIVGGGREVAEGVRRAQAEVFEAVDAQVTEWRIEHNTVGWRADAFLYCTEAVCPECGWRVPLAPSWVIGEKTRTVAQLTARPAERCFAIDIRSGVERKALAAGRDAGTVKQSRLECPHCRASTPMTAIRGDRRGAAGRGDGLRRWENDDLVPRPDDVFQERLYCVRWRLPSLDGLLWAEQTPGARASRPHPDTTASRPPGGRACAPLDDRLGEVPARYDRAGGRLLDTPPAGEMPAHPGIADHRPAAEGTPPAPVPDWADLGAAIAALAELLGDDERRELARLRERDWRTEDQALAMARSELEAKRQAGSPQPEIEAAARRVRALSEALTERSREVERLAKSLPKALYRAVDDADLEREARPRPASRALHRMAGSRPYSEPGDPPRSQNERADSHARLDALASSVHAAPASGSRGAGPGLRKFRVFRRTEDRLSAGARAALRTGTASSRWTAASRLARARQSDVLQSSAQYARFLRSRGLSGDSRKFLVGSRSEYLVRSDHRSISRCT